MIHALVRHLVDFAVQENLIEASDTVWAVNQLLSILHLDAMPEATGFASASTPDAMPATFSPAPILDAMLVWAVEKGLLDDTPSQRDAFDTLLMGCLTPRPSECIRRFQALYNDDPHKATDDFYHMGIASNYIRKTRMERDQAWQASTEYGALDITINLSKPEKDPRDIAKARTVTSSGYPRCLLCVENEGFQGTASHPARQNLRLIPLKLHGKPWFLQYSPYGYYHEHCIILNREHCPMRINRDTFANLAEFLRQIPHYFIGSNADLPIVGGSILSHDHYQGGCYEFPMDRAEVEKWYDVAPLFQSNEHGVEMGRVRWPMSTLRLRAARPEALVELADRVLQVWRGYSDPSVDILAHSTAELGSTPERVPHNTITPIARRRGELYEFDLVLRNNRVNDAHPLGIFHPHAELHHIKKENIGLIEVLGLAILPARLLDSLAGLKQAWLAGCATVADDEKLAPHDTWYRAMRVRYAQRPYNSCIMGAGAIDHADSVEAMLRHEIGTVFAQVLEDSGVFKRTGQGIKAFDRFVAAL